MITGHEQLYLLIFSCEQCRSTASHIAVDTSDSAQYSDRSPPLFTSQPEHTICNPHSCEVSNPHGPYRHREMHQKRTGSRQPFPFAGCHFHAPGENMTTTLRTFLLTNSTPRMRVCLPQCNHQAAVRGEGGQHGIYLLLLEALHLPQHATRYDTQSVLGGTERF